jgi:hypothetical protein
MRSASFKSGSPETLVAAPIASVGSREVRANRLVTFSTSRIRVLSTRRRNLELPAQLTRESPLESLWLSCRPSCRLSRQ